MPAAPGRGRRWLGLQTLLPYHLAHCREQHGLLDAVLRKVAPVVLRLLATSVSCGAMHQPLQASHMDAHPAVPLLAQPPTRTICSCAGEAAAGSAGSEQQVPPPPARVHAPSQR